MLYWQQHVFFKSGWTHKDKSELEKKVVKTDRHSESSSLQPQAQILARSKYFDLGSAPYTGTCLSASSQDQLSLQLVDKLPAEGGIGNP